MEQLFYHDPEKKIKIWVAANNDDRTQADAELAKVDPADGYICRIVADEEAKAEKLTLFENGMDDRVMEALKALYTTQAQEQVPDLEIKSAGIVKKEDKFYLQIAGNHPMTAEIPMEQYESMKARAEALLEYDRSVIIDRHWAVSFLKKIDKTEEAPQKKASAPVSADQVAPKKSARKGLKPVHIISIVLAAVLLVAAAVGVYFIVKSSSGNGMYYNYNMDKYMTVGEYSTEVDPDSAYYKQMYAEYYDQTFGTTLAHKVTEGVVAEGDVVNIDYEGKKDGVAFEGGTDTGYDLTIGSNSFIDGFEEGLVGVAIGSTVDLNLTFPTNYQAADLAGKDVVFTVKVNYVTTYKPADEENVKEYGFESLEDYENAAADFAAQYCIYNNIYQATTIDKYPEKELNIAFDSEVAYYKKVASQNNMSYEDFIVANGMTVESFESYMKDNYLKPSIMADMLNYYILQENGDKLTPEDIETTRADIEKQYGASALAALDNPEFTVQKMAAQEKAFKILLEKAVIK